MARSDEPLELICELCGRPVPKTTRHHLIPREEGGRLFATAQLCPTCHKQLHALYDNRTLAENYATIAALRQDPAVARYLRWVRRQPGTALPRVRTSRSRR